MLQVKSHVITWFNVLYHCLNNNCNLLLSTELLDNENHKRKLFLLGMDRLSGILAVIRPDIRYPKGVLTRNPVGYQT